MKLQPLRVSNRFQIRRFSSFIDSLQCKHIFVYVYIIEIYNISIPIVSTSSYTTMQFIMITRIENFTISCYCDIFVSQNNVGLFMSFRQEERRKIRAKEDGEPFVQGN